MSFKYRISLFISIVLVIYPFKRTLAQDIRVSAKLDSIAIALGDQVWLTLSAELPKNENLHFPVFKNKIIDGIDLLETSEIDTQVIGNNRIRLSQKLLITAFEDSIYKIPPFLFQRNLDSIYSDSLLLMVNYARLDSTSLSKIDTSQVLKIFDVKEPIDTPWTFKEFIQLYYVYILIFIGVAIFMTLLLIYLKRRKLNKPFIKLPEKPREPAHIIAIRALDELKSKQLWQANKIKEYYTELTDILRTYIENRYSIATFEHTSHELLESLKHTANVEKEFLQILSQTLGYADLAKFAKYTPLPNENDLCMKNAYQFVQKTMLAVIVPEKNEMNNQQDIIINKIDSEKEQ